MEEKNCMLCGSKLLDHGLFSTDEQFKEITGKNIVFDIYLCLSEECKPKDVSVFTDPATNGNLYINFQIVQRPFFGRYLGEMYNQLMLLEKSKKEKQKS